MTERILLLAIDATCSPEDLRRVQDYVVTNQTFTSWWNHLPMVFMLETTLSVEAITESLDKLVPGTRFLLTEVNLQDSQGRLPAMSWKWIEKRALAPTDQQSARF